jgi:glycosyltransferase involved in cell wall biosynthesis
MIIPSPSTVSVIIPAQNENETIRSVLHEVKKLQPLEVIVVLNGSTDGTREICRSEGCRLFEYPKPLGNDVGRAIGARYAKGDILLFLDGDIPIPSSSLVPFIQAIFNGHHIAMNNLTWSMNLTAIPHATAVAKLALNRLLQRPDLAVNSLVAVPHAMSRAAVNAIGWPLLANPALAQATAILKGLSIVCPASLDVISTNKPRQQHIQFSAGATYPDSTTRILGDHIAAISAVVNHRGSRGGLPEGTRNRGFLQHYIPLKKRTKSRRSAVIPVSEESRTIVEVIRSVRAAGVDEIIVVANGSDSETIERAMLTGANVLVFRQALGHNVGRAIGAACSTGDVCLFVDGDFVIPPADLIPFIRAVENGIDVALNDLECLFHRFRPIDPISAMKYFLNICCKKPELLNASMTAVPHAVSKRVIETVGYQSLIIPPLAQVKAVLAGYQVKAVHHVDVVTVNRPRPDHRYANGIIPAFQRIAGDHLEALEYLISQTNERGGFADYRNYSVIHQVKGMSGSHE